MKEKMYKISEASRQLKLKSYVLRYWETEFPQIRPKRTLKGQRLYSEKTIDLLSRVKYLLYDQGLTIEGARKVLSGSSELAVTKNVRQPADSSVENISEKGRLNKNALDAALISIQKELSSLKEVLQNYPKPRTQ